MKHETLRCKREVSIFDKFKHVDLTIKRTNGMKVLPLISIQRHYCNNASKLC